MTVNAPASWGKLEGVVTGLGYCEANPQPLADAALVIAASSGLTWTVKTDAAGFYQRWLDQAGSPFTLTANSAGYLPESANGISVSAGFTTTVNFNLLSRWLCPKIWYLPIIRR